MKRERTKTEKAMGMLGFVSIVVIVVGLLVFIWSQPWIPVAKLILSACIGLSISIMWHKGNESMERQKRFEEMEKEHKNRKSFTERLEDLNNNSKS